MTATLIGTLALLTAMPSSSFRCHGSEALFALDEGKFVVQVSHTADGKPKPFLATYDLAGHRLKTNSIPVGNRLRGVNEDYNPILESPSQLFLVKDEKQALPFGLPAPYATLTRGVYTLRTSDNHGLLYNRNRLTGSIPSLENTDTYAMSKSTGEVVVFKSKSELVCYSNEGKVQCTLKLIARGFEVYGDAFPYCSAVMEGKRLILFLRLQYEEAQEPDLYLTSVSLESGAVTPIQKASFPGGDLAVAVRDQMDFVGNDKLALICGEQILLIDVP